MSHSTSCGTMLEMAHMTLAMLKLQCFIFAKRKKKKKKKTKKRCCITIQLSSQSLVVGGTLTTNILSTLGIRSYVFIISHLGT